MGIEIASGALQNEEGSRSMRRASPGPDTITNQCIVSHCPWQVALSLTSSFTHLVTWDDPIFGTTVVGMSAVAITCL